MATAKKLPSGSWRCRVLVGTETIKNPDGSIKKKQIFKSFTSQDTTRKGKAEAERMAAEYLLSNKEKTSGKSYTLKEAMDNVLKIKENAISPTTYNGYLSMAKNCYNDYLDVKIDKIKKADVQKIVNDLAMEHSPKYVKNAYSFLVSAITMYIPDAKFDVKLPQKIKPKTYTPTDDEVKEVITYLKENDTELLKALYLAAFGTLRRSEICAATTEDIEGNILRVNKNLVRNSQNEWVLKTTKTVESTRYVNLPDFVIESMPKSGPLVSINPHMISCRFAKVVKKLDVPHFRFHDLRHYAASIMHAIGVPDQYIMLQGGWKSDAVLKRVYRGTMDDYKKKFADKTTDYFSGKFGNVDTETDTN